MQFRKCLPTYPLNMYWYICNNKKKTPQKLIPCKHCQFINIFLKYKDRSWLWIKESQYKMGLFGLFFLNTIQLLRGKNLKNHSENQM